ncbi:MAG TPA: hypothetical protein VK489_06455 [Ferruginibacter sp.]|nr:hypothetical protein [Ferruginibacter sp.]
MKYLSILVFSFVSCITINAQSRINSIAYQKINRDAIVNDIPFPESVTGKAIQDTLEKLGYKGKESKGFTVYKGVKLSALGSDAYDLYFMVDRKSKKEKELSVVTMMISKGFDDFVTEKSDADLMRRAKTYLDSLRNAVAVYDLGQQVIEQDDVVKKNEKKASGLVADAEDLQKRKKKLEAEIEQNIKDQENQQKELEKQKQILGTLKSKGQK